MSNLNKAKNMYHDKNKEYERCAEAVRIAEQAAELGAAGEGKVGFIQDTLDNNVQNHYL